MKSRVPSIMSKTIPDKIQSHVYHLFENLNLINKKKYLITSITDEIPFSLSQIKKKN